LERALGPVRDAVLGHAKAHAAQLVAEAESEAAEAVATARAEAARLLAEARAEGEADAGVYVAAERARNRRAARALVLTAQRQAYETLKQRSREAVQELRNDDGYHDLLVRLSAAARAELGASATVTEHEAGGVTATAGQRRLDYSLATLADRAVTALGAEVERLWRE
jgi:hypothetical protein